MSESPSVGRPRRPTLLDVARLAQVSRATASLVIRDAPGPSAESRERVRRAADMLGYRPDVAAQLLRSQRSQLLGVVFSAQEPFHADLIESIYAAAESVGYDVVLSAVVPTRDERRAFEALTASRCAAAILLGVSEMSLVEFAGKLPAVEIGRRPGHARVDAVYTADDQGARLAVEHLISLGHNDIVHVDGGDLPGAQERRQGYRDAMAAHGLQRCVRVIPGDYTESSGSAAARELLAGELPTAVIAGNDRCAVGVLDEFRRDGVEVPGRVSLVGYDNSRLARLAHVDLTTVRQNTEELARHAVEFAIGRLDGTVSGPPRVVELTPDLVIRGSTSPAR